ncbi:hypothetical protein BGZ96_012698 [Linnemannia gamsii]|uniref:Uncharacterized protein n=1 Tax=Linnemannia gamsii TaxID=64522 RepID=A0ABQ7KC25_9FUNG|nr:hypothetical protein BGZ96_012698 [Linnemannia gamsii]
MPFLSLSNNPRSRASLIAAFLFLEFMAVLWLREFSPTDSISRASLFNPRSQPSQQKQQGHHSHKHEEVLLQAKKHHVSTPKQEDSQFAEPVVARSGKDVEGQAQGDTTMRQDTGGNNSNKDQGSREQQEQKGRHPHQRVAETTQIATTTTVNNQSASKRATERIKSKVSSLAAAAAASIPKARKAIKGNNKSTKGNIDRKPAGNGKHPNELKNQRGGFKSTRERKQAQLIPVLDEHGATIEDHFISPRDSDGDGVPDYFVLLRPSADNGNSMMDLGLFDDDTVVPVPAPLLVATAPPPPVHLVVVPAIVSPPVAPPPPPPPPAAAAPVTPIINVEAAATTIPFASAPIAAAATNAPTAEPNMSSPSPLSMVAPIDS